MKKFRIAQQATTNTGLKTDIFIETYLGSDVDALLADVRRLVDEAKLLIESAEDSHSHCDCYEVATLLKCSRDTEKAIAAVEWHLEKVA